MNSHDKVYGLAPLQFIGIQGVLGIQVNIRFAGRSDLTTESSHVLFYMSRNDLSISTAVLVCRKT